MKLFGWTPLHEAALVNDVAGARAALAYVGKLTRDQYAPLNVAGRSGATEVVELLLASGADPHHQVDTYQGNALSQALTLGHFPAAAKLLAAGSTVDVDDGLLARRLAYMRSGARLKHIDGVWVSDRDAGLTAEQDRVLNVVHLPGAFPVQPSAFTDDDPVRDGSQSTCMCIALRHLDKGEWPIDRTLVLDQDALYMSVMAGHADVAIALVRAGAPVTKHYDQSTALIEACGKGALALVAALLEAGADVGLLGSNAETALMRAAQSRKEPIIDLLLASGADRSAADTFGSTAFDKAKGPSWRGKLHPDTGIGADSTRLAALMKEALAAHPIAPAAPTPRTHHNDTPSRPATPKSVRIAAPEPTPKPAPVAPPEQAPKPVSIYKAMNSGDLEVVRVSLEAKPHDAGSALQSVTQQSPANMELFELVMSFDPDPNHVASSIGYAARMGHLDMLRRLLTLPAKFRHGGAEAVYGAVYHGQPEALGLLLAAGMDATKVRPGHEVSFSFPDPPEDGAHPLLLAITKGDVAATRALLEGGMPVNFCTHKQRTPLDLAHALGCDHPLLDLLLAHGATPIHDDLLDLYGAAIVGRPARMRLLLPDASQSEREQAVRLACQHGHQSVVEVIVELDRELKPFALGSAAANGQLAMLQWLHGLGVPVTGKTTYRDWTPLHSAAYAGHEAIARWLLEQGASVNALDKDDATPLHAAALGKSPEVVALLLAHGANPKARDDEGKNALAHSKKYGGREEEQKAIAKLLKAGGAKDRTPAYWKRSLKKKLKPHALPAYPLRTKQGPGPHRGTRFGGHPWLANGEAWPLHDGTALQFLYQLDLSELPNDVGAGLLRVFLREGGGFRADDTVLMHTQSTEGQVVVGVSALPPRQLSGFLKARSDLPGQAAESLVTVDPAEREHLQSMPIAGDKAGGWPAWIQDDDTPAGFHFVLQVDTGGALAFSYGDSGIGMLMQSTTDPSAFRMAWQSL